MDEMPETSAPTEATAGERMADAMSFAADAFADPATNQSHDGQAIDADRASIGGASGAEPSQATDQADGAGGDLPAGDQGAAQQGEPPAPAAEPEADDLRAVAERARQKRLQAQQQRPPEQTAQPTPQPAAFDPSHVASFMEQQHMLLTDPLGYIEKFKPQGVTPRQFYERLTAQATGQGQKIDPEQLTKSFKETVDTETAALRKEIEDLKAERQQEQQRTAQQKIYADYETLALGKSDDGRLHYPYLAALEQDERREWGDKLATAYNEAGEQWDLAKVARAAEASLRKMAQRFAGVGNGAGSTPQSQVTGDRTQARPQGAGPSTLTSEIASETAGASELLTEEERMAAAMRFAESAIN